MCCVGASKLSGCHRGRMDIILLCFTLKYGPMSSPCENFLLSASHISSYCCIVRYNRSLLRPQRLGRDLYPQTVVTSGSNGRSGKWGCLWCGREWEKIFLREEKTIPNHCSSPTWRERKGSRVSWVPGGGTSMEYRGVDVVIINWHESWWQLVT